LLVSKDRAVLKQRKRVATHYGATVGNVVVLDAAEPAAERWPQRPDQSKNCMPA
jgi:hypothetical protein